MTLLVDARRIGLEIGEKVEVLSELRNKARKILDEHGKSFPGHGLYGKQLVGIIDGVEVQIFDSAIDKKSLATGISPIIVAIPISQKSISLLGEKSIIQDDLSDSQKQKHIDRISVSDLHDWEVVIQLVEESFRFNQ